MALLPLVTIGRSINVGVLVIAVINIWSFAVFKFCSLNSVSFTRIISIALQSSCCNSATISFSAKGFFKYSTILNSCFASAHRSSSNASVCLLFEHLGLW